MYHPRLRGTHYEMGKHYGEILRNNGVNMAEVFCLSQTEIDFGKLSLPIYEKYAPNIMEEAKGLALGLAVEYTTVAYWLIALYCFESDHGCSVFAYNNGQDVIYARNMDMFPEFKKT